MKKFRIYQRYMLRPLIYLTAFRLMVALILQLAIEQFVPNGPAPAMIAAFLAMGFALLAYLVYLRMDGLGVPRMKYIRPKKKADPLRAFGEMSDHMDDEPGVAFDELEEDERDFCSLIANLIGMLVFLTASFLL